LFGRIKILKHSTSFSVFSIKIDNNKSGAKRLGLDQTTSLTLLPSFLVLSLHKFDYFNVAAHSFGSWFFIFFKVLVDLKDAFFRSLDI
jgi:hypothetical protein